MTDDFPSLSFVTRFSVLTGCFLSEVQTLEVFHVSPCAPGFSRLKTCRWGHIPSQLDFEKFLVECPQGVLLGGFPREFAEETLMHGG